MNVRRILVTVEFWNYERMKYLKNKALRHNEQTAALLLNFGFGHVLQYTPFNLHFSALHFTHSYTTLEGVPKFCISTHPPIVVN